MNQKKIVFASFAAGAVLALGVQNAPQLLGAATAATAPAPAAAPAGANPKVKRWRLDELATMDLGPSADRRVVSGTGQNRDTIINVGQNTVGVWEAGPAKMSNNFGAFPYDEVLFVLQGTLKLTEPDGTTHVFRKGDFMIIPKGFRATWEMMDRYRQLSVQLTDEFNASLSRASARAAPSPAPQN